MKKNVLVTLLTLSVFSVLLFGCGSEETTVEQTENTAEDTADTEETEEDAESLEEETAQELTLEEWLDAQNFTEYTYCLWNESNHEGTVIEYGNTYNYDLDEDIFVLYKPEEIDSTSGLPSKVIGKNYNSQDVYSSRNLFFYDSVTFDGTITSTSGTEYTYNFTLVSSEEAPPKVDKEFPYYLQTKEGENIIGFNMPDNYTFDWTSDSGTQFRRNDAFLGICKSGYDVYDADESSFDPVYEKVDEYDSSTTTVTSDGETVTERHISQTDSYLPVGTKETIYGTAKLFVHERRCDDSDTGDIVSVYIQEEAFLYYPAMNAYVEIYYMPNAYSWQDLDGETSEPPTLDDYTYTGTIEELVEELFD